MLIDKLDKLPSENDLTEILFNTFVHNPILFKSFLAKYAMITDFDIKVRSELWKKLNTGIPDMYFENDQYVLVFENKMKAGFSNEQLPRYIESSKVVGKINKYFLIAPDTTRYKKGNIPPEYIRLTWDELYLFLKDGSANISSEYSKLIENSLSRYRYLYYCSLFDNLYEQIADKSDIYSPELFSKDNYHSRHITINNYINLKFSIGIYLAAPSYIKINPWWVKTKKGNYKIIDSNPQVRMFRDKLYDYPKTNHLLEKGAPGYVIDINLSDSNNKSTICSEIINLINNECKNIIHLYQNMNI